MIQVTYHRDYNRVTVKGHAGSDEPGKDLVCASASILAYTLAANVANLEEQGAVRDMTAELREGDTEIACTPNRRNRAVITLIFDTVCAGFELLAKQYPQYISYEIIGAQG